MSTTVRVAKGTHDSLEWAKAKMGTPSADETIRRLLVHWTPDAAALFEQNREAVLAACAEFRITRLVAFGSRVRADRRPESDLDLVAEFEVDITLFDLSACRHAMSTAFGVEADLGMMPPPGSRLAAHIENEGMRLV